MANTDDTLSWLYCECQVCEQLDAIAHDAAAWRALLTERGMECPAYARNPDYWRDGEQLTRNGDGGGCEAGDHALGVSPMSPEQLQLEGVEP